MCVATPAPQLLVHVTTWRNLILRKVKFKLESLINFQIDKTVLKLGRL
jgi:hypothetical protein